MNNICEIHNEVALFCEQNASDQTVYLCRFCVQQKFKIQNVEDINNQKKQALQQLELKSAQKVKQLKDFADNLEQYTQQIYQKLQKIKQLVNQNMSLMIEKQQQVKNLSKDFTHLQLNKINEQQNMLDNQFNQIKEQLTNQLKELERSIKIDQLNQSLNNFSNNLNKQESQIKKEKKMIMLDKKFDYQLMKQSSYKQNDCCLAIAFNKDGTKMVASGENLIKVFEFNYYQLREVQQLNGHSDTVTCLQFMKKSNQFISASGDSTMIIWIQNINNLWQINQVLKGHNSCIRCITINQNADILISGSYDQTIKFWHQSNNTWNFQQSINCQSDVEGISLSEFEDKLIASVYDKQILVIILQGKVWKINQKISVNQYGNRLCFINQDQFIFQSGSEQHLQIFDFVSKEQIFKQGQQLEYSIKQSDSFGSLFPIRYITQIGLIMVKHGNHVHLIKRDQNGQFKVEQSIKFANSSICGSITDDGRYIATWDDESREIQIRKFDY